MEILQILRKLEPLMPARVKQWRRSLDFAHPELKGLLERQILQTAYRVLGDFRSRLLLSLPPAGVAKGAIHLGTIRYEKDKWPAGISTRELSQNLAIFGRSGSGKTNVAFHLLEQLVERRIPFLFLDWKRTAAPDSIDRSQAASLHTRAVDFSISIQSFHRAARPGHQGVYQPCGGCARRCLYAG